MYSSMESFLGLVASDWALIRYMRFVLDLCAQLAFPVFYPNTQILGEWSYSHTDLPLSLVLITPADKSHTA